MNEVTINSTVSAEKTNVLELTSFDTDHVIVIAQRGWIFEGYRDKAIADKIRLLNANVVRRWTNGRGIGGLAKEAYKNDYTLDPVGVVEFAPEGVIAVIFVEW